VVRFWPSGELSKPRQCSIAFLEPCCSSGMRTNEDRVVAAVVLPGTIPLASPKVTDYSIRSQPVAGLLYDRQGILRKKVIGLNTRISLNRS
jgi:hypothetical protein